MNKNANQIDAILETLKFYYRESNNEFDSDNLKIVISIFEKAKELVCRKNSIEMTAEEAINWLSPITSPSYISVAKLEGKDPLQYIDKAIEIACEALKEQKNTCKVNDNELQKARRVLLYGKDFLDDGMEK